MNCRRLPLLAPALLLTAMSLAIPVASAAPPAALGECVAWQIGLERAGFSPGLIDGKIGSKSLTALREFQQAHGLAVTGEFDAPSAAALGVDVAGAMLTYTVQPADQTQVTGVTRDWLARSRKSRLGYASLADCLAEKFHCSTNLLARLNGGRDLSTLKVGDRLIVPGVRETPLPPAERLEVDLAQKIIRAYDGQGRPIALFHCSIAADPAKRPDGQARVTGVVTEPTYLFDPAMWPEVKNVHARLTIPPGPRNPVGLCWINLSLPGYGIHGTPTPELIGKTGSHGCFRLTNWDALRLGRMVRSGTPVSFAANATPTLAANATPPVSPTPRRHTID